MDNQRVHYPRTTPSQRKVLFQKWEETGDIGQACQKARVSAGTFYYWRARFESGGYEAVEQFASHAPQQPERTSVEIEQKVVELRRQNESWGKQRITDELAKKNNWIPVISPNTIKRILEDADLWGQTESGSTPPPFEPVTRTAEMPGQSLNIDLCFVPADHETVAKLPAVSGSSGRLVVERLKSDRAEANHPGAVFADEQLDYAEAMRAFVAASKAKDEAQAGMAPGATEAKKLPVSAQKRLWRQQEAVLVLDRRHLREQRRAEDTLWKTRRTERQIEQAARKQLAETEPRPVWGSLKAQTELWEQHRRHHQHQLSQRRLEDDLWRQNRLNIRAGLADLGVVTAWIAVLVMVDNCSRQCLSLPLFVAGANLTAEMVMTALQVLLPSELQFLITDRGIHFTAKVFDQLEHGRDFLHVLIARHRPQSNGIAERFVRTLKEWLANKSWQSDQQLALLLDSFIVEYNNRPHQGLPTPGLSPNEFAHRAWLM